MDVTEVIALLKQKADAKYRDGMLRFGIENEKALGVKIPELRQLAKQIKSDHELAQKLWATDIHEARILASMIDDPALVTPQHIDRWAKDFTSWDICDQVCGNLFDRTPYAIEKAIEFSAHKEEFVKRAGFVLMAACAVHNKKAPDDVFISFFPIMEREAWDDRNFVKKAVNWALRQVGKRNRVLLPVAIACAERILLQDSKAARWIAGNALSELRKKIK
ncbi:DNA alkylation repair protein [Mucilaginibacter sp. UR6-11]|uniref:DNA alkylation repair protein n=1 Tax=Mucilaginibacter sp. UR6-11 TaxID=1435644 RepID=UPI001E3DCE1B|nr:DNA alkylation repair protein [Mucilaginibacter sp. UR6-11]MCC8425777.1 DNA alkylation repair protein [Mucilaginibacter sp. UR6-11]